MLTTEQVQFYRDNGYVAVPGGMTPEETRELQRVTDDFIDKSRAITVSDKIYDVEEGHTAEHPRLRRLLRPEDRHPAYEAIFHHPRILKMLQQLLGPAIRHQGLKLNLKPGGGGEPVEWHQDWAFYPHTNDDLCVLSIMLDDVDQENGPLLVVPGSHKGPILDHHQDGFFAGAVTDSNGQQYFDRAVPLTGKAGDITIHHGRTLHGSATNFSQRYRRLLFITARAADAWPLVKTPELDSLEKFNAMMLVGEPTLVPRLADVPVRLPLPRVLQTGASIFEKQRGLRDSPFIRKDGKKGTAASMMS